jgi:predicted alpha/beta superfamily hydrolase
MDTGDISAYPAVTLFSTHARTMFSKQVGVDYAISIWLPASYATGQKNYPVLYILDGNVNFGMAANLTPLLAYGPEVPDLIIVGIGNHIASYADWEAHRNRDYTPTANPDHPSEGGAPQFLEFIETELIPLIDANYRTDPTDRVLWGYSLAGTFVLYALLKRPTLFHRYIAGSPSLGFADRAMFQYEMDLAQSRSALPLKLAITACESEGDWMTPVDDFWSLYRPRIEEFWTLLRSRNYEGLKLRTLVMAGETHMSGVGSAYTTGLRAVFS